MFIILCMRSLWRTLGRDVLRDIALVCLAVLAVALSYGAIAVTSGFPLWLPVVLGVFVLGRAPFLVVVLTAAGVTAILRLIGIP